MGTKYRVELSDESMHAIKFALRIARADAEKDYAKAERLWNKEAMVDIGRAMDDIDAAMSELGI